MKKSFSFTDLSSKASQKWPLLRLHLQSPPKEASPQCEDAATLHLPEDAASPAHFPRMPILCYTFFFVALVFMAKQNKTSESGVTSSLYKTHVQALEHVFW